MATFPDLNPLPYFGNEYAATLRAVGWLGREQTFRKGTIAPDVYRRLRQLFNNPFQPFVAAGGHSCDLCQFESEATGSANLFVPADDLLLVCPELILHYINAHGYEPPKVFCDAVA